MEASKKSGSSARPTSSRPNGRLAADDKFGDYFRADPSSAERAVADAEELTSVDLAAGLFRLDLIGLFPPQ